MSKLIGLPNRVVNSISNILLNDPRVINFLYYTSKEDEYAEILDKEVPPSSTLIDKNFFIGRRIPIPITDVGAFLSVRTATYRPDYMNHGDYIKLAQIDISIICHKDCQRTLYGTRDITLVALIQDALSKKDLSGIADHYRIISVSDILGLHVDYSGYTIKLEITGFSDLMYD